MNVKKENTWRALKDEPMLITSWLCRFGWHRWEQWSDPYIPKGGSANIQTSTCACCNRVRVLTMKDQNGQSQ